VSEETIWKAWSGRVAEGVQAMEGSSRGLVVGRD